MGYYSRMQKLKQAGTHVKDLNKERREESNKHEERELERSRVGEQAGIVSLTNGYFGDGKIERRENNYGRGRKLKMGIILCAKDGDVASRLNERIRKCHEMIGARCC